MIRFRNRWRIPLPALVELHQEVLRAFADVEQAVEQAPPREIVDHALAWAEQQLKLAVQWRRYVWQLRLLLVLLSLITLLNVVIGSLFAMPAAVLMAMHAHLLGQVQTRGPVRLPAFGVVVEEED